MIVELLTDLLLDQDFIHVESEEQFKAMYPEKEHGKYRPQPYTTPDTFPCYVKQEGIMENSWGADHVILSIVYPPESV